MFSFNFFTDEEYKIIVKERMNHVFKELAGIIIVDGARYRTPPPKNNDIHTMYTPKTSQDFMNIGFNNELSKVYYHEISHTCWYGLDPTDTMLMENILFDGNAEVPYFNFFTIHDYEIHDGKIMLRMDSFDNFIRTMDANVWARDIYGGTIKKYIVNTVSRKCTCPGFKFTKKCKHLDSKKRKINEEIDELTKKLRMFR